jgi:hypothetical protein
MPIAEQRMVDSGYLSEGTLTNFAGIPFTRDYTYSYFEAKRILRLLMLELRSTQGLDAIAVDRVARGRKAIKDDEQERVWDYLALPGARDDDDFNERPHLTAEIRRDRACAYLTLPHSLATAFDRRLRALDYPAFRAMIAAFVSNAASLLAADPGAAPFLVVQQRHYHQRTRETVDAMLEFDPRTALADGGDIKRQDQWLQTAFDVYTNRNANVQLAIGVAFPYAKSMTVANAEFSASVAAAWCATKPLTDILLGRRSDSVAA